MTENDAGVPRRVIAYVDGFNFYRGLMAKGWGQFRWLDYRKLLDGFVLPDEELRDVKYFTSLVEHEPAKLVRQKQYLRALEETGGVTPIHGRFVKREAKCPTCNIYYKRPQEKLTDVNFATHLVADAHDDLFDVAIVICADSDLVPAVRHVKDRFGKIIRLIDPPERHSNELAAIADDHLHFTESVVVAAQLPDPVEYLTKRGKTKRLYRPPDWA